MKNYMRCTNCGYDLYGPEYLAHMINENATSSSLFLTDEGLLSNCLRSSKEVECPFCHHTGEWTSL
jgi:hypothetical protein